MDANPKEALSGIRDTNGCACSAYISVSERVTRRSVHPIVGSVANLKDCRESKGLPAYHPHQLGHAFATHLLDHGASLQHISRLLGEAKLSTAQIYTRVSVGRMMEVYKGAHPHTKKPRPE
jgi:integrase/recombinase XerD